MNDLGLFRYVVYQDAKWDWRSFDVGRDSALAEERAGFLNAKNPDLSAFKARGGKLILYHGWNDGGSGGSISPLTTLDYYDSVLARMGPDQSDWLRLYMVPGMAHCGYGPAPDNFDLIGALERWHESGTNPDDWMRRE
ncbi:MAG TPA: tannase/feruloyl esterase family alpha/beta hydrolase [Vicinamibacterales bacterium]|nr:tannase/feruloyl esterase family alpha/beta hydrolase [Vicinamibacterales bacterium]